MTGDTSKKQKSGSERRAIQNREAQRAFRQRKLQRIKDLESQVASLSAGTSGSVSPLKATHCDAPTNSNAELSRLRQLVSELQTEAVRLRSVCGCGARVRGNFHTPAFYPCYSHQYQPYPQHDHQSFFPYHAHPGGQYPPVIVSLIPPPQPLPPPQSVVHILPTDVQQFQNHYQEHRHQQHHDSQRQNEHYSHHKQHDQQLRENQHQQNGHYTPSANDQHRNHDRVISLNSLCEETSSSSTSVWIEDGRKPGAIRSVALVQNALDYRDAICNLESFVPSMTRAKHSRSLVFKMFELFSQQAVCIDEKELHRLSYQLIQARNCVLDCCSSDAERRRVLELIDQCFVRDWTYAQNCTSIEKSSCSPPSASIQTTADAMIQERRNILMSQMRSLESLKRPELFEASRAAMNELADLFLEYVNVKEGLLDQSKLLRLMDVNTSILNMCDAQDRSTLHGILDEGRKKLKPILDVMIAGII